MKIIEEKYEYISFNFFKNDNCTQFKFNHQYKVEISYIIELISLTPEQRLESLTDFLSRGDKGKSCEFYFQGDFYECGNISHKKEQKKKTVEKNREV